MSDKSYPLTEAGRAELKRTLEEIEAGLLSIAKSDSYVPGEDDIEITAANIRNARTKLVFQDSRRGRVVKLASRIYVLFGIFMGLAGAFYPSLLEIIQHDPWRAILIGGGILFVLAGFFLASSADYLRQARQQEQDRDLSIALREIGELSTRPKENSVRSKYTDLPG